MVPVQEGEVLQVIVGIADKGIEDHLPVKGRQVDLWPIRQAPDQVGQVRIAELIPAIRPRQGLHAQHVAATLIPADIEALDDQGGVAAKFDHLKRGYLQTGGSRQGQAGRLYPDQIDAVTMGAKLGDTTCPLMLDDQLRPGATRRTRRAEQGGQVIIGELRRVEVVAFRGLDQGQGVVRRRRRCGWRDIITASDLVAEGTQPVLTQVEQQVCGVLVRTWQPVAADQ